MKAPHTSSPLLPNRNIKANFVMPCEVWSIGTSVPGLFKTKAGKLLRKWGWTTDQSLIHVHRLVVSSGFQPRTIELNSHGNIYNIIFPIKLCVISPHIKSQSNVVHIEGIRRFFTLFNLGHLFCPKDKFTNFELIQLHKPAQQFCPSL